MQRVAIMLILLGILAAPRQVHAQQLVLDLANLAQTTITAIEEVLSVANQVLELTPIGSMTLSAAWATDLAQMANIVQQASALAYDLNSLQTQITQLFTLSTVPTDATALEQRLTAIRQVITDSYIYAMRTQTLLFTALRTLQHLSGLVGAIDKFVGNKQGYQSMAQLQAQISLTIEKLSMQTVAFQRAQALDRLQDQILVQSLIQINRATMFDHP